MGWGVGVKSGRGDLEITGHPQEMGLRENRWGRLEG